MSDTIHKEARVDPAGRPLRGRTRQALVALSIIVGWIAVISLFFWATRGGDPAVPSIFFGGAAVFAWLATEAVGGKMGLVWPASALGITGSITLGFAVSLATPDLRSAGAPEAMALISATAATSMTAYMFRFRLPGLVSPIITFLVVALFLMLYGTDQASMSRIEGISARGVLSAMMRSPLWAALFLTLGLSAVFLARRLDLKGDDFGLAAARPLHLIGAGVTALVVAKALGTFVFPSDLILLATVWILAFYWALRINRFAVLVAIHLAMMKSIVLAISLPVGWVPTINEWPVILLIVLLFDLAVWPRLHHLSLQQGWTLGPGGRVPEERGGWVWRYWPYA